MILLPIWLGSSLLIVSFWALAGLLFGQRGHAPRPNGTLSRSATLEVSPQGEAA